MKESKQDIRKDIGYYLSLISKFDVDSVCDNQNWRLSFFEIRNEISRVVSDSTILVERVEKDFEFLMDTPDNTMTNMRNSTKNLWKTLQQIRNFIESSRIDFENSPDNTTLTSEKTLISKSFHENHSKFYSIFGTELAKIYSETSKENENLTVGLEKDISKLYTKLFSDRVTAHEKASNKWLIATVAIFIVGLSYLFFVIYIYAFEITEGAYLKFFDHVALRVILFSLIAYALHFSSQAYRFNKRQQIRNEDKDAALDCFPKFMRTSIKDDPELYRGVMLQITQAIFDSRDSEYPNESGSDKVIPNPSLNISVSKSD